MPPTTPADEQPLTQEELDALALVQNAMVPDVLRRKAAAIAGRLYDAMQTGKQSETAPAADIVANEGPGGKDCEAKSVETCRCGGSKSDKRKRRNEKRKATRPSINSYFPEKKNSLTKVPELEALGVPGGEVYIAPGIARKIVSRKRSQAKDLQKKLSSILSNFEIREGVYDEVDKKGKTHRRLNLYNKTEGKDDYIVIEVEGKDAGAVITYIPHETPKHKKEKSTVSPEKPKRAS